MPESAAEGTSPWHKSAPPARESEPGWQKWKMSFRSRFSAPESATSESGIGTQPSWLCRLAVVPTALDFAVRMTANPAPAGRPMPLGIGELLFPLPAPHETNCRIIPKGHPQGSTVDCGDLSPLFNAKLAEPDFGGLATFIEAKRTFGPSWKRGTAQQASPRQSGDKSHAVQGLRHPRPGWPGPIRPATVSRTKKAARCRAALRKSRLLGLDPTSLC